MQSSRAHTIVSLTITQTLNENKHFSTINIVDLAGSERLSQTGASGKTLNEGNYINLSLSTLNTVIRALAEKNLNKNILSKYCFFFMFNKINLILNLYN